MRYVEPRCVSEIRECIAMNTDIESSDIDRWAHDIRETNMENERIFLSSRKDYYMIIRLAEGIWGRTSHEVSVIKKQCTIHSPSMYDVRDYLKESTLAFVNNDLDSICHRCPLRSQRNFNFVPGTGNTEAELMIIGEAPAGEEVRLGVPFVGPSGAILNQALKHPEVDIPREQIFISNLVKCRLSGPMRSAYINACNPLIEKEIRQIQPKIILLLGRFASFKYKGLSTSDGSGLMANLHGTDWTREQYPGVRFVACYHPASLLRGGASFTQFIVPFIKIKSMLGETHEKGHGC